MKPPPKGYSVRRATMDDVAGVAALTAAVDKAQGSEPTYRADEILVDWQRPGFDLASDTWVIEREGDVAAFGHITPRGDSDLVLMAWVHPHHDQWALSFTVMSAMEPRAREIAQDSPYKRAVAVASEHEEALHVAIEAEGFGHDALFVEMIGSLEGRDPQFQVPEGVSIQPFDEAEVQTFYDVLVESFEEHWGAGFPPFDEWWRDTKALATYDPELCLIAAVDSRTVGVLFSTITNGLGEIHDIGVLKRYRGRGIGEVLMLAAFEALMRKQAERVRLWVDTKNVTNAIRLYEKVGMHVKRKLHFFAKDLT